jgi:hypothetical protein
LLKTPPPGSEPPQKTVAGLFHGFQFALTILLGLALGHWLDLRRGWTPFGTLGGFFGGAVVGFYQLARAFR